MIQPILRRSRYWFGCLLILGLLAPTSAQAHKTMVDGDIAGTWHVDPDHNPKAGETSTAWVALTRKGGALLPLSEASCKMQVYTLPRQPEAIPILEPPVKAIAAEQYTGIPGADVVFPSVGQYQLQLNCTPIQENDFAPFQLQYDVTVTPGNPTPVPSTVAGSPLPPLPGEEGAEVPQPSSGGVSVGGAIALLSVAGVGGWLWFTRRKPG